VVRPASDAATGVPEGQPAAGWTKSLDSGCGRETDGCAGDPAIPWLGRRMTKGAFFGRLSSGYVATAFVETTKATQLCRGLDTRA